MRRESGSTVHTCSIMQDGATSSQSGVIVTNTNAELPVVADGTQDNISVAGWQDAGRPASFVGTEHSSVSLWLSNIIFFHFLLKDAF